MRSSFAAALVVLALSQFALAQSEPKIHYEGPATWDFGTIEQGELREWSFTLENKGNVELNVTKIGITCGCLKVTPIRTVIAAGAKRVIKVNLDSTRVSGDIKKAIFIESNDRQKRRFNIAVEGTIITPWTIDRRSLIFGKLEPGQGKEMNFKVFVRKGRRFELDRLVSSNPHFETSYAPFGKVEDEKHGIEVTVKLKDTAPGGKVQRGNVALSMRGANKKIYEAFINLYADVLGPLQIKPDRLSFGPVVMGKSVIKTVVIEKRKGEGLRVLKVLCNDPQISWTKREVVKGKRIEIDFKLTPNGKRRQLSGRVHVTTNEPAQKLIRLAFRGAVRPG